MVGMWIFALELKNILVHDYKNSYMQQFEHEVQYNNRTTEAPNLH